MGLIQRPRFDIDVKEIDATSDYIKVLNCITNFINYIKYQGRDLLSSEILRKLLTNSQDRRVILVDSTENFYGYGPRIGSG